MWIDEQHPYYFVLADGQVIDSFESKPGFPRLTWSQEDDIAKGYKESLEW